MLNSNTCILGIGVGISVGFAVVGCIIDTGENDSFGKCMVLIACSLPFLACAIAQLTTSYAWRNLKKGNIGVHREDGPVRYWISVIADIVIFAVIFVLAVYGQLD